MRECCEWYLYWATPCAALLFTAVTFTPFQPKVYFIRHTVHAVGAFSGAGRLQQVLQLEIQVRSKNHDNQCLFISILRPIHEADLSALS